MINHRRWWLVSFLFLTSLAVGCQSAQVTSHASNSTIADNLIVKETGTGPGRTDVEIMRINNCDGKAPATQVAERGQSVQLGGGASLGAGVGVVQAAVMGNYSTGAHTTKSLQLTAPPGTHMEYNLEWTMEERNGMVTKEGVAADPALYRYFRPFNVQIAAQRDLGCSSAQMIPTPQVTIISTVVSVPSRPSDTPTPSPARPTSTPKVTDTPIPPPTQTAIPQPPIARSSSPGELRLGEPFEQDDISLNLIKLEVRSSDTDGSAAARASFKILNKSNQKLTVEMNWSDIHMEDSLGNRYVDWETGTSSTITVSDGGEYAFDRHYSSKPGTKSRLPADSSTTKVIVDRFGSMRNIVWRINRNPEFIPVSPQRQAAALNIGGTTAYEGLQMSLKNADIRAGGTSETAAISAVFALSNKSGRRILVQLDYSHIYAEDNFGRRFIDWDGTGLSTFWLEPGGEFAFQRHYTEVPGERSRVTKGAQFVLFTVYDLDRITGGLWKVDVTR